MRGTVDDHARGDPLRFIAVDGA